MKQEIGSPICLNTTWNILKVQENQQGYAENYEVLLVSQFTLYGIMKGNKPDFHVAMPPQTAKPFYASLVEKFRKSYTPEAVKVTPDQKAYVAMRDTPSKASTKQGHPSA
ncbi:hypothetical protein GIB67_031091 [Kingdonia uniflora]|uniref:D-aminoacyl-tRNA deacylase n=1 Tax=Kingdonia uniflora TaxID=39325 RepID=A0A7J7P2E1_9MAGN|nr:hypothetical protein GIB67_031091 [Kingdonia uniflora]